MALLSSRETVERKKKAKVVVGLSGGVDSSLAAAILKQEGYDVVGTTMMIFDGSPAVKKSEKHGCYGPGEKEDVEMADSVCKKLGIPLHVVDLRKEYGRYVLDYFRREYLAGKTPNPCIVCNQVVKFGFLLEKVRQAGIYFDYFATGHYAQIERSKERFFLKRAIDVSKDQTYFLYTLSQEQLSRTLFPVGGYTKKTVREMARFLGLETAARPESQDFVSSGGYTSLFSDQVVKEGDIVDVDGNILGRHRGIIYYTVGQRRGLGISSERPFYVTKLEAQGNRVVVGEREGLFSDSLTTTNLNLIAIDRLDRPYKVKAKIRLKHKEADATVFPLRHGRAKIVFNRPQMSVTPGQSAVLYSGDMVFGGGIIERAI
ncbi:MAG: tRNA 2-thiouridine(34) synthase MnmA [Pseudomonadota bacterium]